MDAKQEIIKIIEEKRQGFTEASDAVWDYAEIRFEVGQSAGVLCRLLEQEGFQIQKGIAGMEHCFAASYGTEGPVIGILAEYDALSGMSQVCDSPVRLEAEAGGNGHGCGHNALGAGAVAGAVGIAAYLQQKKLPGIIKVFGCPAEESGYGKAFMAREGIFDQADVLLTWHPMDSTGVWGAGTLAVNQLYFSFQGVSSHAGAAPEMGRSALDAAELMNVGVQFLREHIIDKARIHYAFMDVGGQAANVVQSSARLHYFIRAPRQQEAMEITDRVIRIAQGAALMTDTEIQVDWDAAAANYMVNKTLGNAMYENLRLTTPIRYTEEEYAYAQTYFDSLDPQVKSGLTEKFRSAFPDLPEEKIQEMAQSPINDNLMPCSYSDTPMTGSTDVGDASWIVPTGQITVAYGPNGSGAHSWQWVACGKSSIAHKALLTAGKVIAMTALDLLQNPEILENAKTEHQKNLGGRIYKSAMPDSVLPH